MFKHENIPNNEVRIDDFEEAKIGQMLEFMYTDKIDETVHAIEFDLLAIAHKYEVKSLLDFGENVLMDQLTVENVIDAWTSSSLLPLQNMTEKCEHFVRKNWENVKKSQTFSEMRKPTKMLWKSL